MQDLTPIFGWAPIGPAKHLGLKVSGTGQGFRRWNGDFFWTEHIIYFIFTFRIWEKYNMKNHCCLISLCVLIGILHAIIAHSSAKNNFHGSSIFAASSDSIHSEKMDSIVIIKSKKSNFNPGIAIPVSLCSGVVVSRIFMELFKDDPSSGLANPGDPGSAIIAAAYMGFFVGFACSMTAFLIVAHYKNMKDEEKSRTSSFDVSIASQQLPLKSRIYFLNYKYHF